MIGGMVLKEEVKRDDLIKAWEVFQGSVDCGYTKKVWTSEKLRELSNRLALELKRYGVKRGDCVALMLSNTVAFPVVLLSLLFMECNPLLLHVSTTKVELDKIAKMIPIDFFIHDYIEATSRFQYSKENAELTFEIQNLVIYAGKMEIDAEASKSEQLYGTILHLTSGTSGEQKVCVRDQKVAIAEGINYVDRVTAYNNIRIAVTTPLSHAFAYGFGLISALITNSTLVLDVTFNPRKLLKNLAENPCDILTVVPPMLRMLLSIKKENPAVIVPNIVFYAGVRCEEMLLTEFEEKFGVTVYTIYGSTETGAMATNYPVRDKLNSVGKILTNVNLTVVNTEKYRDFNDNTGEVLVRATSMMNGYYPLTKQMTINDEFKTGDLGYWTEEKELVLIGRMKTIINVGGIKVDPRDIENTLLLHPSINDVVAYPGKSSYGEDIVLCAVAGEDVNIDEIRKYCYQNLSRFKVPREFYVLPQISRNTAGKCILPQLPGLEDKEKIK